MTEVILVMNGLVTKSYRKLMYGQINDTKHTKTFISRPFGNSLVLRLVDDLFYFIFFFVFAHGARVGRQKNVFRSEAERNFFISLLMGRSGNRKPDYFLGHRIALPCCGYSLESHWRCVFKEYPQRVLWRNKQNYPLNITRYPPYLFHFLCAQWRLRSPWAYALSDQSLRCPLIS